MKKITDSELLIIAENWESEMPINTGIKTAFAAGFRYKEKIDEPYQLIKSALEAIIDPIGHMKKQLKEDERLDGMYAIRIAERPEFYQDIARKALEEIKAVK